MIVKVKEMCFVQGSRRRAGEVFDYKGSNLPKFLEAADAGAVVEAVEAAEVVDEREEIGKLKVKLAEYGVKVPRSPSLSKLQSLIAEVEGRQQADEVSPNTEVI